MAKIVFFTRMTMGLGLAASLFLGCQQFLGEEDKASTPARKADPDVPAEVALRLPPASLELCDSLRLALSRQDPLTPEYGMTKRDWSMQCVEAKPTDDPAYCAQLVARQQSMDTTSEVYYILEHEIYRRCPSLFPPAPIEPPPPPPPAIRLCDSLRLEVSSLDPATVAYGTAKHAWSQQCVETKPFDDPTYCGHLATRLKPMDETSREYHFLKLEAAVRCPAWFPAEPVKPVDPAGPPIGILTPESLLVCDTLRAILSTLDPLSEAYGRAKQAWSLSCVGPKVMDPLLTAEYCAPLVARLASMDPASREYSLLQHEIFYRCPDTRPVEPIKPPDPVNPIKQECEDLQKRMAGTDSASEDYTLLKNLFSERCLR